MSLRPSLPRLSVWLLACRVPGSAPARLNPADEAGASSVEYALLVAGIAAICVVVLAALGVSVHDLFDGLVS